THRLRGLQLFAWRHLAQAGRRLPPKAEVHLPHKQSAQDGVHTVCGGFSSSRGGTSQKRGAELPPKAEVHLPHKQSAQNEYTPSAGASALRVAAPRKSDVPNFRRRRKSTCPINRAPRTSTHRLRGLQLFAWRRLAKATCRTSAEGGSPLAP